MARMALPVAPTLRTSTGEKALKPGKHTTPDMPSYKKCRETLPALFRTWTKRSTYDKLKVHIGDLRMVRNPNGVITMSRAAARAVAEGIR